MIGWFPNFCICAQSTFWYSICKNALLSWEFRIVTVISPLQISNILSLVIWAYLPLRLIHMSIQGPERNISVALEIYVSSTLITSVTLREQFFSNSSIFTSKHRITFFPHISLYVGRSLQHLRFRNVEKWLCTIVFEHFLSTYILHWVLFVIHLNVQSLKVVATWNVAIQTLMVGVNSNWSNHPHIPSIPITNHLRWASIPSIHILLGSFLRYGAKPKHTRTLLWTYIADRGSLLMVVLGTSQFVGPHCGRTVFKSIEDAFISDDLQASWISNAERWLFYGQMGQ